MVKSKTGLMLVEDPEDTIMTLCKFENEKITKKIFKEKYEEIKKLTNPTHKKTADTHFYTLSIYKLIIPCENSPKGTYKISNIGKILCKQLEEKNIAKYQKTLSRILLNNHDKGELFESFLNFVKNTEKCTKDNVYKKFKNIPGRTLIAWSKSAGLIEVNGDILWTLPRKPLERIELSQFKRELIDIYNDLSKTSILGIQNLFVEIAEIRQLICTNHNWTINMFDNYLRRLLATPFGQNIRLYGATSSTFNVDNEFVQNNKSYIYIRIKV